MIKVIARAIFICGLFFYNYGYSQDLAKADSAIQILNTHQGLSENTKLKLFRCIYANHPTADETIKYALMSIDLVSESTPSRDYWLHNAYLHLGYAYKLKGNLNEALEVLLKSLDYAHKLGKSSYVAVSSNAIAMVYRVQGDYPRAIEYYNKSMRLIEDEEEVDQIKLAAVMLNIGECYRINNQLDSALSYFNQSSRISKAQTYQLGIAYNMGNIGLIYEQQGEDNLAKTYLEDAINLLEAFGDNYPIAVYDIALANIYEKGSNYDKALEYAKHSYTIAKEEGLREQRRDASRKLAELYSNLQDHKKAYAYQQEYYALKDTLVNETVINAMADLLTEYEVDQKENEVELLRSEGKSNTLLLSVLSLVIVGSVGGAFMLYRKNRRARTIQNVLAKEKEDITVERDQLDALNETKDQFFAIVSNELKEPVQSFREIETTIRSKRIHFGEEINKELDNSIYDYP
ncbi:tetratricopeptide repeat protein [Fulvivirga maritima]|uniref:tetratricopeptide repeat protein n=1 Tax=Fulvivirga maritima TaxID=2904247 RepID=UPI001F2BFE3B|nr:tetratricopeptide repeat protein [Fulvivirga maritima]UII24520.1 tetratricopeptide repeat protein [Fulvivirga maritima]